MTTDELRRALDRIAESAPAIALPDDTWTRARRSTVRDRAAVGGAALAVVAAIAAGFIWLPEASDPPVADQSGLAVPDRLQVVPERMSARENDGSWMRDEVTSEVTAVGVGAAAWVTNDGLPVVVSASDGAYHLLDLPDFAGNNETFARGLGEPVVSLSPDGRRLAYGYAVFGPEAASEPIPSGVAVIDLATSELYYVPVEGEEGTAVSHIEWSPNGQWLAFTGAQQGTWTAQSMGTASGDTAGPVIGRIRFGETEAEVRPITNDQGGLAIDDDGTVSWFSGRLRVWDDAGVTAGSATDDGGIERALGVTSDGAGVRLDGNWEGRTSGVELVVENSDPRLVIEVDDQLRGSLSVATALMTKDRPTVARPEPDWPWSEERWSLTIGLGVAAAIAVLMGLRRLWRRALSRDIPPRES